MDSVQKSGRYEVASQKGYGLRRRLLVGGAIASLAVPTLFSAHPARSQPNPPRAQLTEDLRLDAEREDFPRIGRLFVGPGGKIAVPVFPDAVIKMFDVTGKHTGTVGRKGRGPGEFEAISRVGWLGDTMWVTDGTQRRVSLFTSDGKLIRTVANPSIANKPIAGIGGANAELLAFFSPTHPMADGSLVGEGYLKPPGQFRRPAGSAFVRVSPAGDVSLLTRLPYIEGDERFFMSYAGLNNPIPFVAVPQLVISGDAALMARVVSLQTTPAGGTIAVTLFKTTGDTLFHKTFPYRGEPIPKAVRDSAIAAQLKRDQTEGPSNLKQQFQAIAKRKTPFIYSGASFVLLGLDNTVWVGLHPTNEGQKMLVFNTRGDAVATVILPKRTVLRQANARSIWVTETDDDDLNSVVRYRVTGIPCESPQCR
jgi:hypothetical protein